MKNGGIRYSRMRKGGPGRCSPAPSSAYGAYLLKFIPQYKRPGKGVGDAGGDEALAASTYSLMNLMSISPLLLHTVNVFVPFSLFDGRLLSPFLILHEIA